MQNEDPDPWAEVSEEELAAMRALTPTEVSQVDALLLSRCGERWQKVALVLGKVLNDFEDRFPDLPFEFLTHRIQQLGLLGTLEIAGDPFRPRHSEIRLNSPDVRGGEDTQIAG